MTENEKQKVEDTLTIVESYKVSGLAVASMVLGICSIFILSIIGGILSIAFGCCGLGSVKKGKGMAWAGVIIGTCSASLYMLLCATSSIDVSLIGGNIVFLI